MKDKRTPEQKRSEEQILCIRKQKVFDVFQQYNFQHGFIYFPSGGPMVPVQGKWSEDWQNFLRTKPTQPGDIEDPEGLGKDWLQAVVYVVIAQNNAVFAYRRSSKGEGRLTNSLALGFGGHVRYDASHQTPFVSIRESVNRELNEELEILWNGPDCEPPTPQIRHIGFLYDQGRPVEKVHFGYIYLAKLLSDHGLKPRQDLNGKDFFQIPIPQLIHWMEEFEPWSRHVAEMLLVPERRLSLGLTNHDKKETEKVE